MAFRPSNFEPVEMDEEDNHSDALGGKTVDMQTNSIIIINANDRLQAIIACKWLALIRLIHLWGFHFIEKTLLHIKK